MMFISFISLSVHLSIWTLSVNLITWIACSPWRLVNCLILPFLRANWVQSCWSPCHSFHIHCHRCHSRFHRSQIHCHRTNRYQYLLLTIRRFLKPFTICFVLVIEIEKTELQNKNHNTDFDPGFWHAKADRMCKNFVTPLYIYEKGYLGNYSFARKDCSCTLVIHHK